MSTGYTTKEKGGVIMFLSGLDEIDQRIVKMLIQNSRTSYSELGAAVGLSRVAAKARVASLEKQGIIEEYTTIINPQKVSGAVSCYFELEAEPARLEEIVDVLNRCETVTQIYRVSGRSKLHIHAVAADQQELEEFLSGVMDPLPGVTALSTNVILARIKDIKGLRL